jgi:Secretory lipase
VTPTVGTALAEEQLILLYAAAGFTVVVPDYEGVNLDWAAGQESGYGTLDGIRAAENLLGLATSTPVGMVGYSGGSIATEFASELASTYSPELNLVGAAEGGLPVDLVHNLAYINGSRDWSGVIPAVLVSLSRAFAVNFQQYLSPYGAQVTSQVSTQCINSFAGSYPGLTYQQVLAPRYQDIFTLRPFVRVVNRLIMGRTGTPKGPLFIGVGNSDGTGDGVMVAGDVEGLAHKYCKEGVSVQFTQYAHDNHQQAALPFETGALAFLVARLNGIPAKDGCASIGNGNSLAPVSLTTRRAATKVKLSIAGPSKEVRGVIIRLWTTGGSVRTLVISLRHSGRPVAKLKLARLTSRPRRLVLRADGKLPQPGRYTLTVAQEGKTLVSWTLTIR